MSNKLEKNLKKKANHIYNKGLLYALVACALSAPWILPNVVHVPPKRASLGRSKTNKPSQNPVILAKQVEPLLSPVKVKPKAQETNALPKIPVVSAAMAITAQKPNTSTQKSNIDDSFIDKMEGVKLKGYVPNVRHSHSGVTVGAGFDLGQMMPSEFKSLTLSPALKAKLEPYIGLKNNKALAFLKSHPLSITPTELKEVDSVAINKILTPLAEEYKKSSGRSFSTLPEEAQTAIFSYAYQYGPGFMKKSKKLWSYFVNENWQKASQTLKSSRMYAPRRKQEAHLLDKIVA